MYCAPWSPPPAPFAAAEVAWKPVALLGEWLKMKDLLFVVKSSLGDMFVLSGAAITILALFITSGEVAWFGTIT